MSDFDFVSTALIAVLAANGFIAFAWASAIVTLALTFWWLAPLFMREKIKSELDRERRRARRLPD